VIDEMAVNNKDKISNATALFGRRNNCCMNNTPNKNPELSKRLRNPNGKEAPTANRGSLETNVKKQC